jgi:hypothetical protein
MMPVWQIFSLSNDSSHSSRKIQALHDELQTQITNLNQYQVWGGDIFHINMNSGLKNTKMDTHGGKKLGIPLHKKKQRTTGR